jgi:hypothetical protein
MRRTKTLPPPRAFPLRQWVFAGCRKSLLGSGPSQRYLRESFPGCLVLYPGGSPGAYARFFPVDNGLPREEANGSASHHTPPSDFTAGRDFRDDGHANMCSGLQVCLPPRSLPPQQLAPLGGRGVYVRAECLWLPSCTSDMLAVRLGQLTARDFHPIRLAALSAAPSSNPLRPAGPGRTVYPIRPLCSLKAQAGGVLSKACGQRRHAPGAARRAR